MVEQVGGTHYQTPLGIPQHWDLAIMYRWDPFQYQITKYIMRWKTKYAGNPQKQLEDLKKARSFIDKYIESYEAWLPQAVEMRLDAQRNVVVAQETSLETIVKWATGSPPESKKP